MGKIKDLSNTRCYHLFITDKRKIRFGSKRDEEKNKNSSQHGRSYWLCRCDCGNELWVRSDVLNNKKRKSCGCDKHAGDPGDGVMGVVYAGYRKNAEKRGVEFKISKEFFKDISSKNCYYCGSSPYNCRSVKNYFGDFVYNGVDRVDNNRGYEEDNCVPCCKKCNRAKDVMTKNEFIEWIKNLYNKLKCNGDLDE